MKVLVCGSRDYDNKAFVFSTLDPLIQAYGKDLVIIQGGATGADWLARMWAKEHNIRCEEYHADWDKYGKAAGPIRNKQMLDEGKPDLVIAFPKDGNINATKGTKNMVTQAVEAHIETIIMGGTDEFA